MVIDEMSDVWDAVVFKVLGEVFTNDVWADLASIVLTDVVVIKALTAVILGMLTAVEITAVGVAVTVSLEDSMRFC